MALEPYLLIEEPRSYQKTDILDFFGIPPAPEEFLEENIKAKRQFWGKRANGVGGRAQADAIKTWIQKLSKLLEDGTFPDQPIVQTADGGFSIVGDPETPLELAEQFEMFLRQGDVANVLSAAQKALETWPDDSEALLYIALALSELLRDHFGDISEDWKAKTGSVTSLVLSSSPTDGRAWLARARYALATQSLAEVDGLESRAQAAGVMLPAEVYGVIATSAFRGGNTDAGIRQLIRQVAVSDGDPAVRSVATDAILREVVIPLLPIVDKKGATAYVEAVAVAAWLADGVPESQSEIIGHRIWAQQSAGGFFIGDFALKSFLGVLTGFLALPIYGNAASRPGWRVLRDGPTDAVTWQQFNLVASNNYIEAVHAKAKRPFEWQGVAGEPWPDEDEALALIERHGFTKGNKPFKARGRG